jgi:hypothetical protein
MNPTQRTSCTVIGSDHNSEQSILGWFENEEGSYVECEDFSVFRDHILTCRLISRQRRKYTHATIEPASQKRCFLCGSHISIAGQRMFSIGPPRDYISSPVVEREREWSESSAVKEERFG